MIRRQPVSKDGVAMAAGVTFWCVMIAIMHAFLLPCLAICGAILLLLKDDKKGENHDRRTA
jgi:hypothetical protein